MGEVAAPDPRGGGGGLACEVEGRDERGGVASACVQWVRGFRLGGSYPRYVEVHPRAENETAAK